MPKLLPLSNPEDWRIDETGRVLVHRVTLKEGSNLYTLYQIQQVSWATTVRDCLKALTRWLARDGPPQRKVA